MLRCHQAKPGLGFQYSNEHKVGYHKLFVDDKLLLSTHCYTEKTLSDHSKSIESTAVSALRRALRQEGKIQTLKHQETKGRVQRFLLQKTGKQILGG